MQEMLYANLSNEDTNVSEYFITEWHPILQKG